MNDIVVYRLFSAGLCLQSALALMNGHRAAREGSASDRRAEPGNRGLQGRAVRSPSARFAARWAAGLGLIGCRQLRRGRLPCRFPARRRPGPVGGWGRVSATRANRDRTVAWATWCKIALSRRARAHRAERRPVGPGQRQPGRMFPRRGQRKVSVQDREQLAARPSRLPPQREHGGLTVGRHVQEMHLHQLGHPRRGAQRANPGQASNAIAVGPLRHPGQQPAASQLRQPGHGGTEAQIQQHLVSDKHLPIAPGTVNTPPGTKVPSGPRMPLRDQSALPFRSRNRAQLAGDATQVRHPAPPRSGGR